jgi:hypothetical protein
MMEMGAHSEMLCFSKRSQDGGKCPRNVELVVVNLHYVVWDVTDDADAAGISFSGLL